MEWVGGPTREEGAGSGGRRRLADRLTSSVASAVDPCSPRGTGSNLGAGSVPNIARVSSRTHL